MPSDSRKILDAFLRREPISPIGSFSDWLFESCSAILGLDLSRIDVFVQGNKKRLWNYVKTADLELRRSGSFGVMDDFDNERMLFNDLSFNALQSATSIRERKLGQRWAMLRFSDTVSWRQYEALGAAAAALFGAEKVELTPPGNEGGVDFYAVVPARGPSRILHGERARLKIVGQCKKYSDGVEVGRIRDFCKTVENVRCRSYDMATKIPNWFNEYNGPVVGWINAHSGFQEGSRLFGEMHGILLSDSVSLAESLLSLRATPLFSDPIKMQAFFGSRILELLVPVP